MDRAFQRAAADATAGAGVRAGSGSGQQGGLTGTQPGPSNIVPAAEPVIDRLQVCPLLLRVFCKLNSHHRLEDFSRRGQEPKGEAQMYTWPDATLGELSELVRQVKHEARGPRTQLSFALVYPDKRGHNVMRQVGTVHSSRPGEDDNKALASLGFQTGDFMDVAILRP